MAENKEEKINTPVTALQFDELADLRKKLEKAETRLKERDKISYNYLDRDLQARQLSTVQKTDLTDGGATVLHSHTPVATGFTSRIRAYLGSNQDIDPNAFVKVSLDTESFDGLTEFDNATNYRFTATVAGYYLMVGKVTINYLDAGETGQALIYKNGNEITRHTQVSNAADQVVRALVSDVQFLDVSEYIELYARHDSAEGAKILASGSANNYLAIHRLS